MTGDELRDTLHAGLWLRGPLIRAAGMLDAMLAKLQERQPRL